MYQSDTTYIFSEEQLIDLCREWQERLQLEHWDVALRVCRGREIDNKRGRITYNQGSGEALISIEDQADFDDSTPFKRDMEYDLVHELVHLLFAPFDETEEGTLAEAMMERSNKSIAQALVRLKRQSETRG